MKLLCRIILVLLGLLLISFRANIAFAGNPPDAAHSSLNGTEVPADGSTPSSITITLHDSSDTPLSGDTVSLSAPGDPTAQFSPTSTTLDGSGQATFTMTSTQPGTDPITVTDQTTVTDLAALGNVIFDPVPTSTPVPTDTPTPSSPGNSGGPPCSDTTPSSAPTLYQIVPGSTNATLYFAPPNTQYDGFIISYGLTSDANSYSVTFKQDVTNAAVKYTVNSLTPKTIYYFKVAATKGCAVGPWSSSVSSQNISNIKKLPETGPASILFVGGIGGLVTLAGLMMLFVL